MRTTRPAGPVPSRMFAVPAAGPATGSNAQGMISPVNAFVNAQGQPNPVSFAFLFNLFSNAQSLLAQMTQAHADIAAATSGVTTLQSQVDAIQAAVSTDTTNLATLQAAVDDILRRLNGSPGIIP